MDYLKHIVTGSYKICIANAKKQRQVYSLFFVLRSIS